MENSSLALLVVFLSARRENETDLASGVDDLTVVLGALVGDRLLERALYGRIVVVDKMILDVLQNERRFSFRLCELLDKRQ